MAPHSSTLAWKILWTEEPGRLQSTGSLRVGYNWATSLSLFTFMHWRRKWQPTPVFLPGESQGQGSLVGCRLWGRTESDTTEATQQQQQQGLLQGRHVAEKYNWQAYFLGFNKVLNMEKEMAMQSCILAWRIPWTEKPGGPQSMGSQRVGHDWGTNATQQHSA